ncbi:outer membrane receptor protein involved in Fe transport [Variovorax sp. TBS-050B]|uniref:TonB-dependent receptor n=1 Tax=Variovorax sp. TBS-050B TaxID=2940551 RepID=UPI002473F87E|nr:TonB-dependent receptor [Variovorax sp. TBS-050B]MDH6590390.1 outer membrane receptor protein involved in Fe transport [Variovorax sp. TBS-050B]
MNAPPTPRLRLPSSLAFVAGLTCAGTAAAQDPVQTLGEISVTASDDAERQIRRTRLTNDSTGLPSGLSVITSEEIGTLNVGRDISNVFRRVPGVVANNIDQGDTGNGFRMRGFATQGTHGADTAVYVDGVPQNMPSSQAGAGHGPAFLEWITPDMIGRIDVIKGPISALYGDQNRAGAVRVDTRTGPVPSSVGLSLESYGGRRASLVLGNAFASVQSLLVADSYRTDSYRFAGRTERDNLFWKLSTRLGDGLYSLRVNHYRSDSVAAGYLLLPDLQRGAVDPRATQFNLPGFGSGQRTGLVFNRSPATSEEGWSASAYAERFERLRGIASSHVQHTVGSDDRHFYGGRLARNFVFADRASLIVGAELRRDAGDAERRIWRAWLPTANYVNNQKLDLLTYGLFAQGQYKLAPNLKLLAGVRRDWFDYDIDNRKLPGASTHYKDAVTTPKLGAVWSITPALDLFANIAEGFRSPAAEQISGSGATGPLGAAGGTVYDVAPSKVKSRDLGFGFSPSPDWTTSGVVYHTLNQDEIVAQADGSYKSVGETTRKGYEIETRLRLDARWSVYGSYGRIVEARVNNPLPNTGARLSVPEHQLKLGAEYRQRLGAGRLTLNADAYLTANNPYYVGTPQTQLRMMPTYTRYDLKATYDRENVQFTLFAIFQPHRFAADIAYGSAAGLLISPQPRRQVGASVRYFF